MSDFEKDFGVHPNDLRLVNASAGSGKTYTLMKLVSALVSTEQEDPGCILATTFTKKAAGELRQRIRKTLLESDRPDAARQAAKAANGLIGTVNGVAGRILSDYAMDAGMSPQLKVLPEDAADMIFRRAVVVVMDARANEVVPVARRLGFSSGKAHQYDKAIDWQGVVHAIVDRARANGIDSAGLSESREESLAAARRWFDGSAPLTLEDIFERLNVYATELDREDVGVTTKAKYFAKAKEFLRFPSWDKVVPLANGENIGKKVVTPLRDFANRLRDDLMHASGLQEDVVRMIELVFDIAGEGMKAYRQYKERYGLVDFTDQETELLRLLRDNAFKVKLSERVHRVLVDEFQDTSPIQLALFSKLGEVAGGKMTWVGDPKQSIYGFRGADPGLMAKAASKIAKCNCAQLKESWRSKKNLVDFSNALFEHAFRGVPGCDGTVHLEIPEKRKEAAAGGEIEVWMLGPKPGWSAQKTDRSLQLVEGIEQLHSTGTPYGDIAVLMRQGADCEKLAVALSARGVPVSVGGGELFATEEVQLAMAAYRFAVAPQDDTVALATLAALFLDTDGWLQMLSKSPKDVLEEWRSRLQAGIGFASILTPLELLDKVIVCFGVDRQVRKLGDGSRRVGNLEQLRSICAQYMTECSLKGVPATHAGFIAQADGDASKEASVPGSGSVKVLTYHAAKGLEWPVVILSTLEVANKRSPFDLDVVDSGDFDSNDPLKGRKLRWVANPFGAGLSVFKESILVGNADFKTELNRIRNDEREERKRLMYVGVTRAQDRLVFAPCYSVSKKTGDTVHAGWLDELIDGSFFGKDWKSDAAGLIWEVDDKQKFTLTKKVIADVPEQKTRRYLRSSGQPARPIDIPLYKVAPSSSEVAGCEATVGEELSLGAEFAVRDIDCTAELGDCFHNYMAVAVPGNDDPDLAAGLIGRWRQQNVIHVEDLVACGAKLRELIQRKWPGSQIKTEVPMSYTNAAGQVSEGYIDMLVKTADGKYVIIDHKVVKEPDVLVHVKHYAGQQNIYRQSLVECLKTEVSVYLHLPRQGKLAEMRFVS